MAALIDTWYTTDPEEGLVEDDALALEEAPAPISRRSPRGEEGEADNAPLVDSLTAYLAEIGKAPLLTPEQELRLGRRAQAGDREAVHTLVRHNLRLVVNVAKKYQNLGMTLQDLIQEGAIGLLRAAEKYDPTRGFRFSTYATWWIRQAVLRSLNEQSRLIRLPEYLRDRRGRIETAQEALRERLGRTPSDAEIAEESGVPLEQVTGMAQASRPVASLDAPISEDGELALGDLVRDPEPGAEDMAEDEDRREAVERALGVLDEQAREVLRLRFGLGDNHRERTLEEVGRTLGYTRERIRQIEAKALRRLRAADVAALLHEHHAN
jgi:RNA polymerase primary sigma factor